jgi:hypothetical protein
MNDQFAEGVFVGVVFTALALTAIAACMTFCCAPAKIRAFLRQN